MPQPPLRPFPIIKAHRSRIATALITKVKRGKLSEGPLEDEMLLGMISYFAVGFACLGAWIGCLWFADRIKPRMPRLASAISSCALAIPLALLAAVLVTMVLGADFGGFVFEGAFVLLCILGIYRAVIGKEPYDFS